MARALAALRSLATSRRAAAGAAGLLLAWTIGLDADARGANAAFAHRADLLQPSLQGNPLTPPRFQRPGQAAPLANQAPPTNTFTAPSRIGATPIYGSPEWLRRGRHRLRFDQHAKEEKKEARRAEAAAAGPQPNATFTPVPTYTPPASAATALHRCNNPLPEVYPKNAARRARRNRTAATRRTADQQSAARKCIPCRPPTGAGAVVAGSAAGILRLFRDHAGADIAAAQHLSAGNVAAKAAADRTATIPSRRSASARDRFCCCRQSICPASTAPIPDMCRRPVRRPPILSRRRSCRSPRIGNAMRSPPTSSAPTPSMPRALSCPR